VGTPRWLVDEMLGRLARYLRFFGHDTVYVRGLPDEEILRRAVTEQRTLLTRDRELALRTPGAVYIGTAVLADQLRELRAARMETPFEVRFDRCTECNGRLEASSTKVTGALLPPAAAAKTIFVCVECGHRYWEGSHTARIRADVAAALREPPSG
jgi:uncharacterized protein with PIN domain